jgi:hypothetical protein
MKLLGIELRRVPEVVKRSADEVWVTKDGRRMTIGEMDEAHAKHSLALIMRNVRAGRRICVDDEDRVCFRRPLTNAAVLEEWKRALEAETHFDPQTGDWERDLDDFALDYGDHQ